MIKKGIAGALVVLLCGCGSLIALYDPYAYKQAISIKVDALDLMSSATEEASVHAGEIKTVDLEIKKMIEYEKQRPKDTVTLLMWQKLNDPEKNLYGGFIRRWKMKGKLDTAFVKNQLFIVESAVNDILELESKKIRPE